MSFDDRINMASHCEYKRRSVDFCLTRTRRVFDVFIAPPRFLCDGSSD
jgi:hypothetical protein